MAFFERLSNGWKVAKASMQVLNAHKELIIFPILSGLSLLLIVGSYITIILSAAGWNMDSVQIANGSGGEYLVLFLFYIINYFVVVFFNMALMHCAKLYFDGEEVSVSKGLQFSASRVGSIFSWAVFAATVGTILRIAQDNLGWFGRIITSIVGVVWSVATFFVIPVLAYENLGPTDAVKRSTQLMKEKWGEGIGANFSIGIIGFFVFLGLAIASMAISALVNEGLGIGLFALGFVAVMVIGSALHSIVIAAIYNNINGNISEHFNQKMLDELFVVKS